MKTGTVWLTNSSGQGQYFAVRKTEDGRVEYHLGDAARTPDGWVRTDEAYRILVK